MNSIVLQLQRDALDRAVPVSDLLRKALVIARKLKVERLRDWISHELAGYPPGAEIPEYRRLRGQVKAQNPYHGLIPVMFEDQNMANGLSSRLCNQGVPELETLAKGKGVLLIPFPDDISAALSSEQLATLPAVLVIQRSAIVGMLSQIRDTVLNWAMRLEEDGILGDALSFSEEERKSAKAHTYNINNFYGDASHIQVAQAIGRNTQSQQQDNVPSPEELIAFVAEVRKQLPELGVPHASGGELEAELATLESQARSPNPKYTVLRELLVSVRRILESATGSNAAVLLAECSRFFS